jgi:hypothetical protein
MANIPTVYSGDEFIVEMHYSGMDWSNPEIILPGGSCEVSIFSIKTILFFRLNFVYFVRSPISPLSIFNFIYAGGNQLGNHHHVWCSCTIKSFSFSLLH